MIARLICWFTKHKRGKKIGSTADGKGGLRDTMRCPRCKATWTRPAPKPRQLTIAAGSKAA